MNFNRLNIFNCIDAADRKQKLLCFVCPLAAAVFPSLFLFQVNFNEIPLNTFLWSSLVSLIAASGAFAAFLLAGRRLMNTAVAMYFIILVFFSYGSLYDLIDASSIHGLFSSQIIWAVVYLAGCLFIALKLLKLGNAGVVRFISWYASLFVIILFILNIGVLGFKIAGKVYGGGEGSAAVSRDAQVNTGSQAGQAHVDNQAGQVHAENQTGQAYDGNGFRPDIYYIVLDEYASSDTIKKYYGYDNKRFEEFLTQYGFHISKSSVSGSDWTERVLAAVLNMKKIGSSTKSKEAYELISNDRVSGFLKGLGYKYIHIGASLETNKIKITNADYYYNYFTAKRFYTDNDLTSRLIDMSILRPLFYTANWTKVQQESVYYSFDKIREASNISGPKFVFAHIMCPHHPFVFDRNGNPLKIADRKNWKDKSIYLGQYIYVTTLVENLMKQLLQDGQTGSEKPVIIIQSDHGPRKVPGAPEEVKFSIFNAMLLPRVKGDFDIGSIPQEETFKRIFELYFNYTAGKS